MQVDRDRAGDDQLVGQSADQPGLQRAEPLAHPRAPRPASDRRQAAKTSALVLELYGGFVRRLGGRIAIAHMIQLLADLGVDETVVRAAVARLVRSGLLRPAPSNGSRSPNYELTEPAAAILAKG